MRADDDPHSNLPPLKAIQAFEQTARFGNLARAAEVLDLTPRRSVINWPSWKR